ncbi:MAG: type II secretion system GspH family protein [Proteobacteria bacterium]|nr:type II secretion system GspH family protein [Pseudomonadota bacterium]MDE3207672.1 type II secretion system protein [Pseudomonadota bacterium]
MPDMHLQLPPSLPEKGFTLVELVIVMVIVAILVAVTAMNVRQPVEAYLDATTNARLTGAALTATQFMRRELREALPNSVRVTQAGGKIYLEFLHTVSAGQYRVGAPGNSLDFTSSGAGSFDVLSPPVLVPANAYVAIYNLGIPGDNAYAGDDVRQVTTSGAALSTISYVAGSEPFPIDPSNHRFMIVDTPVSYVCSPDAADPASGTITRYSGYPLSLSQPTDFTQGTSSLLVSDVSDCSMIYTPGAIQREGLVSMSLTLAEGSASATLYSQASINNEP